MRAGPQFGADKRLIVANILPRHPLSSKSLFETGAHPAAVKFTKAINGPDSFGFSLDDKASDAVIDNFRDRAAPVCDNGCTACHCFDHDQTKRLRPSQSETRAPPRRLEISPSCRR
jgi:hypothetical protein